jgi:hypothetical protein
MGIVPLSAEHIGAASALHQTGIRNSPVVALGPRFLTEFFYPRALANASFGGYTVFEGDVLAGFITYTTNSVELFRGWLRDGWWQLSKILLAEVIQRPVRLGVVLHAGVFLARQQRGPAADVVAEFLSFVVAEEFRSLAYVQRTGRRLANDLFEAAIEDLVQRGVKRIKLETDQDALAGVFYRNYHMKALGQSKYRPTDLVFVGDVAHMASRIRTRRGGSA